PVQMSATAGSDTGHHGNVDKSAGSARRGSRRNPGTSAAPANPRTKCHHGAGITTRAVAEAADATARYPLAHQTAIPTMAGPMKPMKMTPGVVLAVSGKTTPGVIFTGSGPHA